MALVWLPNIFWSVLRVLREKASVSTGGGREGGCEGGWEREGERERELVLTVREGSPLDCLVETSGEEMAALQKLRLYPGRLSMAGREQDTKPHTHTTQVCTFCPLLLRRGNCTSQHKQ